VTASEPADGRLSQSELLDNLNALLLAGFVTTSNLLGNGLRLLLDDPGLMIALRSGTVPVSEFTEEVLRYDAPIQWIVRRSPGGAQIGGAQIAAGQQVVLLIGAANRDPAQFAVPDAFQPTRSDSSPLSFGAGAHFCLGNALALLEASIAFPMLLSRFPIMAAAGDPSRDYSGPVHRGFASLPIRVGR
jgi:cytochrome P450